MKRNLKSLIICILIPLTVGGISGFLTRGGMESFSVLNKPPLSPPAWLFPVVWTVLYLLMGISSYLIYSKEESGKKNGLPMKNTVEKSKALSVYGYQLLINFLWPVFFFSFRWYFFSFLWLILLWVFVAKMILDFGVIRQEAGALNVPYLLWLSFAGYLNLGIWLLN